MTSSSTRPHRRTRSASWWPASAGFTADELGGTRAAAVAGALGDARTLERLRAVRVPTGDRGTASIAEVAATPAFATEYRDLADSWLATLLTDRAAATLRPHVELLRAAHLAHVLRTDPARLAHPGAVRRVRQARVVPPRAWRLDERRQQWVRDAQRVTLEEARVVPPSNRATEAAEARTAYEKLRASVALREELRRAAHRTYFRWMAGPAAPAEPVPTGRVARRVTPRLPLDDTFFTTFDEVLTPAARTGLGEILQGRLPRSLQDILDLLDPWPVIDEANSLCRRIRLWEDEERDRLPTADPAPAERPRPLVRAVGWGDLVVARERLIGYDAREVAHVENVMAGEVRVREHERQRTVEQVTEVETVTETESQRDLQTTDRYELQTEAQSTIQQDFSIQAGVNTSGRYGLTSVDTSLQAGFQQSRSESRSSTQQVAREIVSKAVERTLERVKEVRRLTVTEQIRELNTHRIENVASDRVTPTSRSGIYVWVEKLLEVELRQYGTRMLVEFHIPEPALTLLENHAAGPRPRKPAPFSLSPGDVLPTNYLCLTERFGALDVQPPPAQFVNVGFAWASAPSEDVDEATAEDTVADTIAVPDGYRPVDGHAIVSAHPAQAEHFDVFVAVGGMVVVDAAGADFGEGEIDFDPALRWPNGVPVSVRAHGHFDKTMVAQVSLRCERTAEALADWQLRTWEQLRNAHEGRLQEYQREVDEAALRERAAGPVFGGTPAENLRVAEEELRKWAIKAMRLAPFNFNAVEQVGDLQEVDPVAGDLLAAAARLFEEAFEWGHASFFLYPYYWSRRETWPLRLAAASTDPRHAAFLRAGSARYIVPVTPGYEARVLHYLESDPVADELTRLDGPDGDEVPEGSAFEDLWLELLLDRNSDTALGTGSLAVTHGTTRVTVNPDSTWSVTERDLGREVYLAGERYAVAAVVSPTAFELDQPYDGVTDANARYATGSVPYGPPWVVRVPTSLVVLSDRRPDLAPLGR